MSEYARHGEQDFGNIDVLPPVDWDGEDAWEMSGTWVNFFNF